jgi:hypothetical protein
MDLRGAAAFELGLNAGGNQTAFPHPEKAGMLIEPYSWAISK